MIDFGKSPAFPQSALYDPSRDQVITAYGHGAEAGMNMQQHVWLQLFCALLAGGKTKPTIARDFADEALPLVLKRMERLA